MDLKEVNNTIDIEYWYYHTKYLAARKMLRETKALSSESSKNGSIVDVGAGSAIFMKAFLASVALENMKIYAIDVNYPDDLIGMHEGIRFVRDLPNDIVPTHMFFMDVLEHVEDDIGFLKKWVRIAAKGSFFLVTVPAFQLLWSSHDSFLDHKRRYNLKEIENVVGSVGLTILKSRYIYATILPVVFFVRKIWEPVSNYFGRGMRLGIQPANPVINGFLKAILSLEVMLCSNNRLMGLSCMILARK